MRMHILAVVLLSVPWCFFC